MKSSKIGINEHLTYKGNLKQTRYGWLRMTPAYSVHLVSEILQSYKDKNIVVLDPFCGTGTTALVCAEHGIESDTLDINPFLAWLANTKINSYSTEDIIAFEESSDLLAKKMLVSQTENSWVPPLHQIDKWWDEKTLFSLSSMIQNINLIENSISSKTSGLLKLAFCRLMIERANVSFGHQSMSFQKNTPPKYPLLEILENPIILQWKDIVHTIKQSASSKIITQPCVFLCDARNLSLKLELNRYNCVITSPPYPNRMSYIRELRPYMYWLGYLKSGREAGELDWKAIGGTWGCATSNVGKWAPEYDLEVPYENFYTIIDQIAQTSDLLARYVHKYFYDIILHSQELYKVVQHGGFIHYIVGNSKFYDVMLPVESIFASIFQDVGFINISIRTIRKRTSKKELFEFLVSAQKPK
jgi:DNA methylase